MINEYSEISILFTSPTKSRNHCSFYKHLQTIDSWTIYINYFKSIDTSQNPLPSYINRLLLNHQPWILNCSEHTFVLPKVLTYFLCFGSSQFQPTQKFPCQNERKRFFCFVDKKWHNESFFGKKNLEIEIFWFLHPVKFYAFIIKC